MAMAAITGESDGDEERRADDVGAALEGALRGGEAAAGDLHQGEVAEGVGAGRGAGEVEEARHDVHLDALGDGLAQGVDELGVAAGREGHDQAIHPVRAHDARQVVEIAQERRVARPPGGGIGVAVDAPDHGEVVVAVAVGEVG